MKTFRAIRILAGIGGSLVLGYSTLPHLIPRKMIEPYCAVPGQVPGERHKKLLDEVCAKMKVHSNDIHLFFNNGFATVSGGCLSLPGKCVIGLPRNSSFTSVDDIRNASISFKQRSIYEDPELAKAFEGALLFSDNHIKFLIAHELAHIKSVHFISRTFHSIGFFAASYLGGLFAATLIKGSLYRILSVQVLIWAIGFMAYKQTLEKLNHWMEYAADESAAKLGPEFSSGGIEYIQHKLNLNCVLRGMNGPDGERMFSEEGDNLQSSHPKETDRLERIELIRRMFRI